MVATWKTDRHAPGVVISQTLDYQTFTCAIGEIVLARDVCDGRVRWSFVDYRDGLIVRAADCCRLLDVAAHGLRPKKERKEVSKTWKKHARSN